jgi:hypothetical protein
MALRIKSILVLLLITSASFAGSIDEVKSENTRKNLFVYRAERKFLGAKVEILSVNGDVLAQQHMRNRKVIIDFRDVRFGTYIIRVSKGVYTQEFTYTKK